MKNIKWIILALFIIGIGGAWYGYSEWNRVAKDLTSVKPDFELTASELIKAFSDDEKKANSLYNGKVCAVKSKVISVDKDKLGLNTVMIGLDTDFNNVSCQMDSTYNADAEKLVVGSEVTMKGICTGFLTDVILIKCVIQK